MLPWKPSSVQRSKMSTVDIVILDRCRTCDYINCICKNRSADSEVQICFNGTGEINGNEEVINWKREVIRNGEVNVKREISKEREVNRNEEVNVRREVNGESSSEGDVQESTEVYFNCTANIYEGKCRLLQFKNAIER